MASAGRSAMSPELLATTRALAADAIGAEVVSAWRERGIEPILLKGPTLAAWLYQGAVRPYGDIDLLVAPADVCRAAEALRQLELRPEGRHVSAHAHPWARPGENVSVDLHVSLWGLHYPPQRCWPELSRWTEPARIGGVAVRALNEPGRALVVALHAAQHEELEKPREDLRRALRRTSEETWQAAQVLADRIGALHSMAEGLALDPAGRRLVTRLPLLRAATVSSSRQAPLAIGLARFSLARGPRGKARVLVAALRRPEADLGRETRVAHALALPGRVLRTWRSLRRASSRR